jgi:hypothetical protein
LTVPQKEPTINPKPLGMSTNKRISKNAAIERSRFVFVMVPMLSRSIVGKPFDDSI